MRAPLMLFVAIAALIAGCNASAPVSGPVDVLDRDAYHGGAGVALVLANVADIPFRASAWVVGAGGVELARLEVELAPGARAEKWWSFEHRGTYSVRMDYASDPGDGRTSGGGDDQAIDLNECPLVAQTGWTFQKGGDMVGSAWSGQTCVTPPPEDAPGA